MNPHRGPTSTPPLTEEQKRERQERLQADHERYIKNIATMRSLPRLQSTIAGAGGKTNAMARIAEEKEAERQQRLTNQVAKEAANQAFEEERKKKEDALRAVQDKKRQRRQAKKKNKRMKKELGEAESSQSHESSSESEDDKG